MIAQLIARLQLPVIRPYLLAWSEFPSATPVIPVWWGYTDKFVSFPLPTRASASRHHHSKCQKQNLMSVSLGRYLCSLRDSIESVLTSRLTGLIPHNGANPPTIIIQQHNSGIPPKPTCRRGANPLINYRTKLVYFVF